MIVVRREPAQNGILEATHTGQAKQQRRTEMCPTPGPANLVSQFSQLLSVLRPDSDPLIHRTRPILLSARAEQAEASIRRPHRYPCRA